MRGFVEGILPQRIYENIHIRYEFNSLDEKKESLGNLIKDMKEYHKFLEKDKVNEPNDNAYPIKYIDGKPHRFSKSANKWVKVVSDIKLGDLE